MFFLKKKYGRFQKPSKNLPISYKGKILFYKKQIILFYKRQNKLAPKVKNLQKRGLWSLFIGFVLCAFIEQQSSFSLRVAFSLGAKQLQLLDTHLYLICEFFYFSNQFGIDLNDFGTGIYRTTVRDVSEFDPLNRVFVCFFFTDSLGQACTRFQR